jgi:hypothetical protein
MNLSSRVVDNMDHALRRQVRIDNISRGGIFVVYASKANIASNQLVLFHLGYSSLFWFDLTNRMGVVG